MRRTTQHWEIKEREKPSKRKTSRKKRKGMKLIRSHSSQQNGLCRSQFSQATQQRKQSKAGGCWQKGWKPSLTEGLEIQQKIRAWKGKWRTVREQKENRRKQVLKGKKIPVLLEVDNYHKDSREGAQETELHIEVRLHRWQAPQRTGL